MASNRRFTLTTIQDSCRSHHCVNKWRVAEVGDRVARYSVWLRAWQVQVGRVKLYLLDTNDAANFPAHRGITSELYGGGPELRLANARSNFGMEVETGTRNAGFRQCPVTAIVFSGNVCIIKRNLWNQRRIPEEKDVYDPCYACRLHRLWRPAW